MSNILEIREGSILVLEFNRPEKKNALTLDMYRTVTRSLQQATRDSGIRAVLFRGNSDVFTAGNDLDDFLNHPPTDESSPAFTFLLTLSEFPKPVVAAVNGLAIGVGTTMLLHCDLVCAADNARFSVPFINLGLCPEGGSGMLLPAIAGYQRAAEKLMLGEPFTAVEAERMGFVNRILPAAEVSAFAMTWAQRLAAQPAKALSVTKMLLRQGHGQILRDQMQLEGQHFADLLTSAEAKEAFSAFLERRKPDFSKFN